MKHLVLFVFRVLQLMIVLLLVSASRLSCEVIPSIPQNKGINNTLFSTYNQSVVSLDISCKEYLKEMQDPVKPLTRDEKKQLRREKRQVRKAERAEMREELRAQRAEEARIDNPNNADYVFLGKNLPTGQNVFSAIRGRVPGLTISDDGYVRAHGPNSFYGGGAALFLVNEVEVSPESVKTMQVTEVDRIEIFTGPSAAIYGTRVGTAVISIYTIQSVR
ncbi:MAG: TonB-dependent receptor plug domain-containing protein [Bacteroidales bacterium]|nr:TonB-dependent receptor plug domain-containing protein [Bacteroidales bacterium]